MVSTLAVEWIEIVDIAACTIHTTVSTLAVEWIEIIHPFLNYIGFQVSTLAVEWIEMIVIQKLISSWTSPPSRWSGLKSSVSIAVLRN